jgi:hypothetical protein
MRFFNSSKIDLTCRCHFGGGGGGTPPPMPQFQMPTPPSMPAPAAPPPLPERVDQSVTDAQQQARQAAARRDGARKSIMAGETGGYSNPVTGNSLLG